MTAAHHSATHLVHEALRQRLGAGVEQRGSLVAPERLRFDFSHAGAIEEDVLADIERDVNAQIRHNTPVHVQLMEREAAIAGGARALFGEKYGDEVRVISMGEGASGNPYSVELCGGTHVKRSGDIGLLKIVHEGAVAAGIRRIEAVAGGIAFTYLAGRDRLLRQLATAMHVQPRELSARVEGLLGERRQLQSELAQLRRTAASGGAEDEGVQMVAGIQLLTRQLRDVAVRDLRGIADDFKRRLGSGVVAIAAEVDGKAAVVVGVSEDLAERISAVDLVQVAARAVGGKGGGGRPDMAQAGGPDGEKIGEALQAVERALG